MKNYKIIFFKQSRGEENNRRIVHTSTLLNIYIYIYICVGANQPECTMSEDENHLENGDPRLVRGPYHPGHFPRLHHN